MGKNLFFSLSLFSLFSLSLCHSPPPPPLQSYNVDPNSISVRFLSFSFFSFFSSLFSFFSPLSLFFFPLSPFSPFLSLSSLFFSPVEPLLAHTWQHNCLSFILLNFKVFSLSPLSSLLSSLLLSFLSSSLFFFFLFSPPLIYLQSLSKRCWGACWRTLSLCSSFSLSLFPFYLFLSLLFLSFLSIFLLSFFCSFSPFSLSLSILSLFY